MPLADTLSTKLNAASIVDGLGGQLVGGSDHPGLIHSLGNVSVPIPSADLHAAVAGTSSIDASPIGGAAHELAALAGPLLGSLPVVGDIMRPLADVIDLVEQATTGELTTAFTGLPAQLSAAVTGDGNTVGSVIRVAQVLTTAPAGRVLSDLLHLLAGVVRVQIPAQLPITDLLPAADGAARILGGLMALDSTLTDADRLASLIAAQLDPPAIGAAIGALEVLLDGTGASLADAVAGTDPSDAAAVAAALAAVMAAADGLDAIGRPFSTAMAVSEAALAQMNADQIVPRLGAASAIVRSADLAALQRGVALLAARLAPLTGSDLGAALARAIDGMIRGAESRVAAAVADVRALDVAQIVSPVSGAIDRVAGLIGRISDVITQITVGFQAAMDAVKNAVAALPVHAIVDAINTFMQPITDVLANIERIIDGVHDALKTVADDTGLVIGQVGTVLDSFKRDVDELFGGARDFVLALNLDDVIGRINDNIRAFSDVLAKAQLKPYFDTADGAISTVADVISKIPFGLLPDSMKQQVDDALKPIKDVDAAALEGEIEDLLDFQPDPLDGTKRIFAIRTIVSDAISDLQGRYDAFLTTVRNFDPRQYLATLEGMLGQVAAAIAGWSPALTLQPLTDAVNQVKSAIVGFDIEHLLAPVHDAFVQIEAGIAALDPTRFVQPIEDRIVAARTQLLDLIRINSWIPTIDLFVAQSEAAIAVLDPVQLGALIEAAIGDAVAALGALAGGPTATSGSTFVTVPTLLGLPVGGGSFGEAVTWLRGAPGDAALTAHARAVADALARAHDDLQAFDVAARATGIIQRMAALAPAVATLAASLPGDSAARRALGAAGPRLRADTVVAQLASARSRNLIGLAQASASVESLRGLAFSEVTDATNKWQAAFAPLAPARALVTHLLSELGVTSSQPLGVTGALRALLTAVPPERLAGIVTPLFAAVRDRAQAVVTSIATPIEAGIRNLITLINQIDLAPFMAAIDGVFTEVESQVAALDPNNLLAAPLAAFKALQNDLATQDPVQQVIQIITNLRDAATALLQKLDPNKLLETPLQIYDHIIEQLSLLQLEGLLDPVFDELDGIAEQVHEGLGDTVTAFTRLQGALPS